jgi:hypothetical protein
MPSPQIGCGGKSGPGPSCVVSAVALVLDVLDVLLVPVGASTHWRASSPA